MSRRNHDDDPIYPEPGARGPEYANDDTFNLEWEDPKANAPGSHKSDDQDEPEFWKAVAGLVAVILILLLVLTVIIEWVRWIT